jgi:hypothetical protein
MACQTTALCQRGQDSGKRIEKVIEFGLFMMICCF